jgi:hypothetical protein
MSKRSRAISKQPTSQPSGLPDFRRHTPGSIPLPLADVPRIRLGAPQAPRSVPRIPRPSLRRSLVPFANLSPIKRRTASACLDVVRLDPRALPAPGPEATSPRCPGVLRRTIPTLMVNPSAVLHSRASLDPRNAGAILSRPPPADPGRHSQAVRRRIANPLSPVQIRVPPPVARSRKPSPSVARARGYGGGLASRAPASHRVRSTIFMEHPPLTLEWVAEELLPRRPPPVGEQLPRPPRVAEPSASRRRGTRSAGRGVSAACCSRHLR